MKGIGVDTVAMSKFHDVISKSGDGFVEHVFTRDEREYCGATANPAQSFAGHFAAKEALLKAIPDLKSYGVDWQDMEISHSHFGAPEFVLSTKLAGHLARINASKIMVSISHSHESAVAMVMID